MNAPVFETLLFEVRGHVALVSLNRPERLNAMNRTMLRELNEACDFIEAEDSIFVAVLTGEGKSFSSGFDLKEQAENTPAGFRRVEARAQAGFRRRHALLESLQTHGRRRLRTRPGGRL